MKSQSQYAILWSISTLKCMNVGPEGIQLIGRLLPCSWLTADYLHSLVCKNTVAAPLPSHTLRVASGSAGVNLHITVTASMTGGSSAVFAYCKVANTAIYACSRGRAAPGGLRTSNVSVSVSVVGANDQHTHTHTAVLLAAQQTTRLADLHTQAPLLQQEQQPCGEGLTVTCGLHRLHQPLGQLQL